MLARQRERFATMLVLPALVLIILFNLVPLVEGMVASLQRQNPMRPNPTGFVGFAHYLRALVEEPEFFASLGRTLVWTAGSVGGAYLVGLGLALLLDRQILGRSLFRALFLIPWIIPEVCTALLWKWLYGDEFGVLNFLLVRFGLVRQPVLWLSDGDMAMAAVILVQVWKLYPVMFVVLLAALQNVPRELHEAAELDGAGPVQRFWHVTLPVIRPTSVIITLLGSIWTFQNFDLVYLLTGGGPANATKVLSTLVYQKAFWALEMGYAAALAMLMLGCLLVLSIAYLTAYQARSQKAAA